MISQRAKWIGCLAAGLFLMPSFARPDQLLNVKLFEGIKEGAFEKLQVVTSSYMTSAVAAEVGIDPFLSHEIARLRQIFNLSDLKLITEAELNWPGAEMKARKTKTFYVFYPDGKEYVVTAAPRDFGKLVFKIQVDERTEGTEKNLLNMEAVLSDEKAAVFGFENSQSKTYFLALQPVRAQGRVEGGTAGGIRKASAAVPPQPVDIGKLEKGAVKIEDAVKPPRIVNKIPDFYPQFAVDKNVQGLVILAVKTGADGRVEDVIIYKSVPELDQAAVDAVKQWTYEPVIVAGKPTPAVFTVQIRFSLKGMESTESLVTPKLIKRVSPVYPLVARQARIEGAVILEAKIDENGNVIEVKVLRSIPLLDQAAIDVVRQWKYAPVIVDGKPLSAVFTVTVRFELH